MKPIRLLAAFAVAGLIGALGVAAAAAPAAAAAHVHARASSAVAPSHVKAPSPAINARMAQRRAPCPFHHVVFTTWYGSCSSFIDYQCTVGNQHSISPPSHVSNSCPRNVLLFSNSNETGNTLCIRIDTRTGLLNRAWRSFRVILGGC